MTKVEFLDANVVLYLHDAVISLFGGKPGLRDAGLLESAVLRASNKLAWLLSGSGVVPGPSRNQACDERAEQGFAASTRVVHKLEEAEVERQLVLRDAPVRSQPGARQRPEPLHRVLSTCTTLVERVPAALAARTDAHAMRATPAISTQVWNASARAARY